MSPSDEDEEKTVKTIEQIRAEGDKISAAQMKLGNPKSGWTVEQYTRYDDLREQAELNIAEMRAAKAAR